MTGRGGEHVRGGLQAQAMFIAGLAVAASYLACDVAGIAFPVDVLWKCAGIVLLGVVALANGARVAAAGLFFSAAGDAALALPTPSFVAGMAFFGIAHLFYAGLFINALRETGPDGRWAPVAGAFLVLSGVLLTQFLPGMGALTAPGLGYQAIITLMAASAIVSRAPVIAKVGALLFVLSDTLIGFQIYKGVTPPPGAVWITYAAAQALLTLGFIRMRKAA